MKDITLVTGLWDLKRDQLTDHWKRDFHDHYIRQFKNILELDCNLVIFGEYDIESFVWEKRDRRNTTFIYRPQDWFKQHFYDQIQSIRTNPNWYNQAGWLPESTQAKLDMYNPVVMSKMFLLNDAVSMTNYDSSHFYWIDAGLTTTVNLSFIQNADYKKLTDSDKFTFVGFPYEASNEIHGFSYPKINEFANGDVKIVGRGGFFGGPKKIINKINGEYYSLLNRTLSGGYMGTEESIFSILIYSLPELVQYYEIDSNGLIYKFFEKLKEDDYLPKTIKNKKRKVHKSAKVGLYVLGFNSPKQFQTLINSMSKYDNNFLLKTDKYLLNNSTDESTFEEYTELCETFEFTEIKKDNIGICGGRQFIAEHFQNETNLDYYFFFEDDMAFYLDTGLCKNGFPRSISDLYNSIIKISQKENFDFLKLNFTEFFGDNREQWAFQNVPSNKKSQFFPGAVRRPLIDYKSISSCNGVAYATGEVYYCNWPQIVSREGNSKLFLETTWTNPYEQTWMSHIFQETRKGKIKPGILLATPTEHDRFEHYPGEQRKEN